MLTLAEHQDASKVKHASASEHEKRFDKRKQKTALRTPPGSISDRSHVTVTYVSSLSVSAA